jgi:hypothetical protein
MGAMGGGAMPGPIALGGGGAGSLAFGGMPSMPAPPGAPPMAAQSAPQQQAGGAYDLRGRGPEEAEDDVSSVPLASSTHPLHICSHALSGLSPLCLTARTIMHASVWT